MTTTFRKRFATLALLATAVVACDASPLPYPPDINPDQLRLSMTASGNLTLSGDPGAAQPGGLALRFRDASRPTAPVAVSARADGSIPPIAIEGYLIDVLRIDQAGAGEPQTLLHVASTTAPDVRVAVPPVDADHDGWAADLDCNDADVHTFPGAAELCDGVDNDCDGVFDENSVCTACASAADCHDGFYCNGPEQCTSGRCSAGDLPLCDDGVPATTDFCDESIDACGNRAGGAGVCGDGVLDPGEECDDGNLVSGDGCEPTCTLGCTAGIEICDGIDNDCDGTVDEGLSCAMSCTTAADCDAGLGCSVRPCVDGVCGPLTPLACDDGVSTTYDYCDEPLGCRHDPCGVEICDGLDNDCDGAVDEDCTGCPVGMTMCGGTCVDLLFSNANCGACGIACAAGEICQRGICTG